MFAQGLLSLIRGQGGQLPDSWQQSPGMLSGGFLDYAQPLQALPGTMAAVPPGMLGMLTQANFAPPSGPAPVAGPAAPPPAAAAPPPSGPQMTFDNLSNENGIGYGWLNGQRHRLDQVGNWQYQPGGVNILHGSW